MFAHTFRGAAARHSRRAAPCRGDLCLRLTLTAGMIEAGHHKPHALATRDGRPRLRRLLPHNGGGHRVLPDPQVCALWKEVERVTEVCNTFASVVDLAKEREWTTCPYYHRAPLGARATGGRLKKLEFVVLARALGLRAAFARAKDHRALVDRQQVVVRARREVLLRILSDSALFMAACRRFPTASRCQESTTPSSSPWR